MKVLPVLVIASIFIFESCSTMSQQDAAVECKFMMIQNPRGQRVDRLGEMTRSQCHPIYSNIVETPNFLTFYEFVRLIQIQYPPTLTLVVKPKSNSLPKPVLVKSGGARDRVFSAVDYTVDYSGETHRFTFGRYAAEALLGVVEEGWSYRLLLSLDSTSQ